MTRVLSWARERSGFRIYDIAKCFACGKRWWLPPWPRKCDKCGGVTVVDVTMGVW